MSPEKLAKTSEQLRIMALLDEDNSEDTLALSPEAEQHYLLALNALEQAQRFATLAHYYLMQKR